MARKLPVREEDMLKIQHVTRANYVKYGSHLLEITKNYDMTKTCIVQLYQINLLLY